MKMRGIRKESNTSCTATKIPFMYSFSGELRVLSPNFHIHVPDSEDMSENEGSWALSENESDKEGIKHVLSMNVRVYDMSKKEKV
jgi:hypothetical protein